MAELRLLQRQPAERRRAGPWLTTVLKEAIAAQHGLRDTRRYELRTCEGCGTPYLLLSVWQPHADDGELACPRCGATAVSWDGTRGYLAYWQRAA